jgi:hypothetical protein
MLLKDSDNAMFCLILCLFDRALLCAFMSKPTPLHFPSPFNPSSICANERNKSENELCVSKGNAENENRSAVNEFPLSSDFPPEPNSQYCVGIDEAGRGPVLGIYSIASIYK